MEEGVSQWEPSWGCGSSGDTFLCSTSLELSLCLWPGSACLAAPLQSGPFPAYGSYSTPEGQACVLSPRAQLFRRVTGGGLQY